MILKEYIEDLYNLVQERPELLMAQVIHSSDAEGNSFHPVQCSPSCGHWQEGDFYIEEGHEDWDEEMECNVICVN